MPTPTTVLFGLFAFVPALPQSAPPSAEEILARYEAAVGDPEARARATNIVMTGKMTVAGMPGEGTVEKVYLGPSKVKWTFGWPGIPPGTQGSTGTYCWSTDPALGVTIREGEEQACVLRQFGIDRHAPWKSLYESAKLVGERDVEGRPCFELEMTPKAGKTDRWYVDRENYRLVGADLELPNPTGGMLPIEVRREAFQEVDGVLYPQRSKIKFGGMMELAASLTVMHEKELAPERVAPSAEVVAAFAEPSKRTQPIPAEPVECSVKLIDPQPCATIRMTVKASEVSQSLATMLPEVAGYLAEAGVDMAGPPFSRYHEIDAETIDLEAGIPTKTRVQGRGRVRATELPGGKAAVAWHFGPYHELPKTYARLEAWMKAQSLRARDAFWEIYWTDPGIEPDPAHWRTQVLWPIE
jgi:effector-binding domain-containing protein